MKITFQAALANLQGMRERLRDLSLPLLKAGVKIADAAKVHIKEGGDPPWEPTKYPWATGLGREDFLSVSHGKRGRSAGRRTPANTPHPILIWTGLLRSSFTVWQRIIGRDVVVGTNVKYARALQEGNPSKNLPARPFLYVDRPMREKIVDLIATYVASGRV